MAKQLLINMNYYSHVGVRFLSNSAMAIVDMLSLLIDAAVYGRATILSLQCNRFQSQCRFVQSGFGRGIHPQPQRRHKPAERSWAVFGDPLCARRHAVASASCSRAAGGPARECPAKTSTRWSILGDLGRPGDPLYFRCHALAVAQCSRAAGGPARE